MMIRRFSRSVTVARWFLVLVLVLGWLVSSCGNDCCPAPKITYPNRESPQGLIDYFAKSLEDKDAAKYAACLRDSYRFEFTASDYDAAGVTPEQPYWGKTEDVTSTVNMFASPQVLHIQVDLSQVIIDFSGPDTLLTITYKPVIDVTIDFPGEEPLIKQVRQSRLYFVLSPDPHIAHLWVIREIREEPITQAAPGLAVTEPSTFGQIKAIFK